jgi:hypothetical protein
VLAQLLDTVVGIAHTALALKHERLGYNSNCEASDALSYFSYN